MSTKFFYFQKINGMQSLITDTQALHYKAYQNSIEVVREELGGFQLFQPTDSLVAEEARKLTLKVVGINDRLRNSIREAIVGPN